MKQLGISIIGTDTDVGKTFVTGLLGAMAVDDGFAVGMVKPVSSSAVPFPECVTMDEDNYNIGLVKMRHICCARQVFLNLVVMK